MSNFIEDIFVIDTVFDDALLIYDGETNFIVATPDGSSEVSNFNLILQVFNWESETLFEQTTIKLLLFRYLNGKKIKQSSIDTILTSSRSYESKHKPRIIITPNLEIFKKVKYICCDISGIKIVISELVTTPTLILTPEPEFLGVVGIKGNKKGIACMADNVIAIELELI